MNVIDLEYFIQADETNRILDEYVSDNKLTRQVKEYIEIEDKLYFYRTNKHPHAMYNEIIAEELAKYLGLNAARYYPTRFFGEMGTLSLVQNNFVLAYDFMNHFDGKYPRFNSFDFNSIKMLPTIFEGISNLPGYNKSNFTNTMKETIKIFAFDMVTLIYDRHYRNWGITLNEAAAPVIFDNEGMRLSKDREVVDNIWRFQHPRFYFETREPFWNDDYEDFFNQSPKEYLLVFLKVIKKALSLDIVSFLCNVETKRNIQLPLDLKRNFISNFPYHVNRLLETIITENEYSKRISYDYFKGNLK